jgi:hypothetical protein
LLRVHNTPLKIKWSENGYKTSQKPINTPLSIKNRKRGKEKEI